MTAEEKRILLTEKLYQEVQRIHNKLWKPFWKSFPSHEAYESWKKEQKDPRLW